ncbi:helix-turn-helix transcriptional regulator [Saccharothrix sp. BKS2]|uniref:helix-turn-helix domain-containing protein n=1 Tax=Saccharothrix sp. BKS2 TaxID=3064400 RepID=UPI0039ED0376
MTEPTSPERTSTAHSRELGAYLRLIRRRSNIRVGRLLEVLDWSASKLSKLECGARNTPREDIFFLLGTCGADKATRDRVMALVQQTDTGSFLRLHEQSVDTLFGLRVHEQQATSVTAYDPVGIPSLVQTDDYAHALTEDTDVVAARMKRQSHVVAPVDRRVTIFLRETALSTVVGSTRVMRDQLLHLTLLSGTPNTVIRVIPQHRGLHSALCHPATLLTLDTPIQPVVHVETDVATTFHDDPEIVATYQGKMRQLSRLALDPTGSRELLVSWTSRYDTTAA